MNVRDIRRDIGVVAGRAGFNAWDYQPDDPQDLPAAVVGGIKEMTRLNKKVTQLKIGVVFYVNAADAQDATSRLDLALSVGNPDSFIDMLDEVTQQDSPSWKAIRFESAGPYQKYQMPGESIALGVEAVLELTA